LSAAIKQIGIPSEQNKGKSVSNIDNTVIFMNIAMQNTSDIRLNKIKAANRNRFII